MKTPEQVVADVTARLRRSWSHAAASQALCGHDTAKSHEIGSGESPSWPHSFPLGTPSKGELEQDFAAYQRQALTWRQWHIGRGVADVELVDANRRAHGTVQAIPTHLRVTGVDAAAALAGRDWMTRLRRSRERAVAIVERFSPPNDLPRLLREVDDWTDTDFALLCDAATWFGSHDATGLTPRQVPVPGMHAKWLNSRQHLVGTLAGLEALSLAPAHPARVHLTYLHPDHREGGGRLHDCVSVGDRVQLPYQPDVVIISENKDTAVAFPPVPFGVCIEGGGFGGAAAAALPWLVDAKLLLYWGDIDTAGFEILNGFRANGVPAASMLMNMATFELYEQFGTSLDRHGARILPGVRHNLVHLTDVEREMYDALVDPTWTRHRRLEQERIPLADALAAIRLVLRM